MRADSISTSGVRPLSGWLVAASAILLFPSYASAQDAPADGERLFRARCASCHSIDAGQNRIGPTLSGVFGREAGKVEGARYSPALGSSDMVWSDQTLDTFLANPRQAVPGTTMTFALRDAAQRTAIIAFLKGQAGASAN